MAPFLSIDLFVEYLLKFKFKIIVLYYTACVNPILQRKNVAHPPDLGDSSRITSCPKAVNKGTGSGCNEKEGK